MKLIGIIGGSKSTYKAIRVVHKYGAVPLDMDAIIEHSPDEADISNVQKTLIEKCDAIWLLDMNMASNSEIKSITKPILTSKEAVRKWLAQFDAPNLKLTGECNV